MDSVGAELDSVGSAELGPAVDSVAPELDSVGSCGSCSVEGGFPASGLSLDTSDSVTSLLTLPSVVSEAELELEAPSVVGLLVT